MEPGRYTWLLLVKDGEYDGLEKGNCNQQEPTTRFVGDTTPFNNIVVSSSEESRNSGTVRLETKHHPSSFDVAMHRAGVSRCDRSSGGCRLGSGKGPSHALLSSP